MMKTVILSFISLLLIYSCSSNIDHKSLATKASTNQQFIIQKYLIDSAQRHSYYSPKWAYYIDKGLQEDSTIAYLWQQKAMPLFKQGKYELAMSYLDKAVHYDKAKWLSYRAFMKCIFSKNYRAAIVDFEESLTMDGNSHVMDHSYLFYIALSKIQLDEYEEAEKILQQEVQRVESASGQDWVHHLVLFYYGITLYEQQKYGESIVIFDKALARYPKFSEVQYYKAHALYYLDNTKNHEEYSKIYSAAIENFKNGYTINEDNAIYERYPYQLRLSELSN